MVSPSAAHNPWSMHCGKRVDGEPYRDGERCPTCEPQQGPDLADVDPALLTLLREAADNWGALGIIRVAASLWPDAAGVAARAEQPVSPQGNTHYAVLAFSGDPAGEHPDPELHGQPPSLKFVAAGDEEFCWDALAKWTAVHPLRMWEEAEVVTRDPSVVRVPQ